MNLLNDYPPWVAAEYQYNARQLYLDDFWKSQHLFDEEMRCMGAEQKVNPLLREAMRLAYSHPIQALIALKQARDFMDEFASEFVDDEYIRMAINGEEA